MPAPACPTCDGRGWVVEPDGGAGRARRCDCSVELVRAGLVAAMGIPDSFRDCTIDSFRTKGDPSLLEAATKARRYVEGFLDPDPDTGRLHRETGLLFVGAPGLGKTHLAVAILREVVTRFMVRGLYVDFTAFIDRVQSTYDAASEERTLEVTEPAAKAQLLVLDELGGTKPTPHAMEKLYLLVNYRYLNRLPTLFTTNYRLEAAAGDADERSAAALLAHRVSPMVLSRLYEMAHPISMSGWDYRKEVRRFSTQP